MLWSIATTISVSKFLCYGLSKTEYWERGLYGTLKTITTNIIIYGLVNIIYYYLICYETTNILSNILFFIIPPIIMIILDIAVISTCFTLFRDAIIYDLDFYFSKHVLFQHGERMNPNWDHPYLSYKQQTVEYWAYYEYNKYNANGGTQNECSICLEPFKQSESRTIIPCRHVFHTDCINQYESSLSHSWQRTGLGQCPLDRDSYFKKAEKFEYNPNYHQDLGILHYQQPKLITDSIVKSAQFICDQVREYLHRDRIQLMTIMAFRSFC